MRKITQLDAIEVFVHTGIMPWQDTTKHRLRLEWVEQAFDPAQRQFLEKHSYTARPHPKHSPTIEIFINEHILTERDWTLIGLLF